MEILVETRNTVIKVQNTEGYQVCTTCRGAKTLSETVYMDHNAPINGGIWYVTRPYTCRKCSGEGFWKVAK
jgi:hypothetical protein